MQANTLIPLERIEQTIHLIRGQKVMLDRDLAALYKVETRALNQAVTRNTRRFPDDFMFGLTRGESMRISQTVISSADRMGLRQLPRQEGPVPLNTVMLDREELTHLRSQAVTSRSWGGSRYSPMAFTANKPKSKCSPKKQKELTA